MKLILTLLVRDEADIIRENILFHLNQGVDFIIATDNKSVDATTDIMREFEKQGLLHYIYEPDDDYMQTKWVTRMAQMAAKKYNAHWVINADADEFWWPRKGNLKQTLRKVSEKIQVLQFERSDFVAVEDIDRPIFERMVLKKRQSFNHIGKPLMPKICHRAMKDVVVGQGNHKICSAKNIPVIKSDLVEILHFPMRSFIQFENKIKLGGAAYERNVKISPICGGGWRMLYEKYKAGELAVYYHSNLLDKEEIEHKLVSGELVVDTRLFDFLLDNHIFNADHNKFKQPLFEKFRQLLWD